MKSCYRLGSQLCSESLGEVGSLRLSVRSGWVWGGGPDRRVNWCCSSSDPGGQTPRKQKRRCFRSPGPGAGATRGDPAKIPRGAEQRQGVQAPRMDTTLVKRQLFFFSLQKYRNLFLITFRSTVLENEE